MNIIKPGILPPQTEYIGCCRQCGCELTATLPELSYQRRLKPIPKTWWQVFQDYEEVSLRFVDCPTPHCNSKIYMRFLSSPPEKP